MNKYAKVFNIPNLVILIFGLCLLCLAYVQYNINKLSDNRNKEKLEMYERTQDSLKSYKNKYGETVDKISVLESSNSKYLTELKTKDQTLNSLIDLVKKNQKDLNKPGSTAIIIQRETNIDSIINKKLDFIISKDKLYLKDSLVNKWVSNKYERKGDSSIWNLKVKDDLSMTIKEDKGIKYGEITNHNPYSDTKNLRIWQFDDTKKSKNKKWGIGIQGGYGIILNSSPKLSPYIGMGVSRNIITF